jgi:hypothetical protein
VTKSRTGHDMTHAMRKYVKRTDRLQTLKGKGARECISDVDASILLKIQKQVLQKKQKSKSVPLPSCRRQGVTRYSFCSFLTSVLEGVCGQLHAPAALYP